MHMGLLYLVAWWLEFSPTRKRAPVGHHSYFDLRDNSEVEQEGYRYDLRWSKEHTKLSRPLILWGSISEGNIWNWNSDDRNNDKDIDLDMELCTLKGFFCIRYKEFLKFQALFSNCDLQELWIEYSVKTRLKIVEWTPHASWNFWLSIRTLFISLEDLHHYFQLSTVFIESKVSDLKLYFFLFLGARKRQLRQQPFSFLNFPFLDIVLVRNLSQNLQ